MKTPIRREDAVRMSDAELSKHRRSLAEEVDRLQHQLWIVDDERRARRRLDSMVTLTAPVLEPSV